MQNGTLASLPAHDPLNDTQDKGGRNENPDGVKEDLQSARQPVRQASFRIRLRRLRPATTPPSQYVDQQKDDAASSGKPVKTDSSATVMPSFAISV